MKKRFIITMVFTIMMATSNAFSFFRMPNSGGGPMASAGFFMSSADTIDSGRSVRIGGEVSAFIFGFEGDFWGWFGLYSDFSVIQNSDRTQGIISFGPEIGMYFFGVDGGLLLYGNKRGSMSHGATVRVHISIPLIGKPFSSLSPFYRVNYFNKKDVRNEFGVLFKFYAGAR